MLDLFSIFSKGGIVLWCFQSTSEIFTPSVNALIRSVILQERSGNNTYNHNALTLQYKLDNEFELVFVVAYQRILQLSYIDKFLNDIHLEFRDKYKNELQGHNYIMDYNFMMNFERVLKECEQWVKIVENKNLTNGKTEIEAPEVEDDVIVANRAKLAQKMASKKKEPKKSPKSPKATDRVKKPRVWELSGDSRDVASLEFTTDKPDGDNDTFIPDTELIGQMQGKIRDLEVDSEEESSSEEELDETRPAPAKKTGGMFSLFKGLVGSKALSEETMRPVLDKLRDHLIMKNVAADIANKLCDSVATRLQGKVLGTFDSVAKTIKSTLTESLVQILSPKRRVDILRDCLQAKQEGRPYVMAFCGVNGVGKSTNLAKICFWLIENNLSVLIAACDTFRAGAVEQLRTHTRHLNALHPPEKHNRTMVQLYEKGYGKDAAGIAMEAIRYAVDTKVDVVLIDTAGRMQDNEPLMRALAKLIKVNEPDMVLFVGEALVGNEAVDQLVKFNQALADHSSTVNPHTIDGIVLTKFDTIDDKVGAAISMTYITGQPIVFVGTGQTYTDLKALNANAVVHALMK
ncbi:Signal recognition particle receptor subunit alpha homolog [Eumeta japonica]|uniref:Signal recognition particle receptor subunit alpha homolog n=1 Tax=Eumeta variegata TaxID=151549 RepID=A0A4C1WIJ9_EUMVA|nr:Signal recognition particle receptor subunit alpha homolog [Eumeta japonica]